MLARAAMPAGLLLAELPRVPSATRPLVEWTVPPNFPVETASSTTADTAVDVENDGFGREGAYPENRPGTIVAARACDSTH